MYQNYIFDLYGTLVDIRTNEEKPYLWKKMRNWYQYFGCAYTSRELRAAYHEWICFYEKESKLAYPEIELSQVFAMLFRQKSVVPEPPLVIAAARMFRVLSLEMLALYDGAGALLERLHEKKKRLFLLSNAQRIFTEPEMRQLEIYDYFDGILYSSDSGCKKPDVQFFQTLFDRYGLVKKDSVMVGNDSAADVGGADQFGIHSVYIHSNQSPEIKGKLPESCIEIKSIGDLDRCEG